jgi:hypothetical protein
VGQDKVDAFLHETQLLGRQLLSLERSVIRRKAKGEGALGTLFIWPFTTCQSPFTVLEELAGPGAKVQSVRESLRPVAVTAEASPGAIHEAVALRRHLDLMAAPELPRGMVPLPWKSRFALETGALRAQVTLIRDDCQISSDGWKGPAPATGPGTHTV